MGSMKELLFEKYEERRDEWIADNFPDVVEDTPDELDELEELVASTQADIVLRMAYVHTVTVIEAFLMYSARALLNDAEHLDRFYSSVAPTFQKKINRCRDEILTNTQQPTNEFSPG